MAETIVRLVVALILAAFELLVQHTGKQALSLWGRKLQRSRQSHDDADFSLQRKGGSDPDRAVAKQRLYDTSE